MEIDTGFDLRNDVENVPYDQKWDVFKPELHVLFHSDQKYVDIARFMKAKYAFDAQIPQYKYRFQKWEWKRSIPSQKKEQILNYAQQRNQAGKRTAAVFGTTDVDPKKLKRYVKTTQQRTLDLSAFNSFQDVQKSVLGSYFPFGVRPFATWSIPLAIFPLQNVASPSSPAGLTVHTPSDVEISTPLAASQSPRHETSNALSPMSQVIASRVSTKYTNLFLQGRFKDLVQNMDRSQMRTMARWFHEYWFFAFKTTKSWGLTSSQSTPVNLDVTPFSEAATPESSQQTLYPIHSAEVANDGLFRLQKIQTPSDLCNFAIHVDTYDDGAIEFENDIANANQQMGSPDIPLEDQLQQALERNDFSTDKEASLPIKPSQIAKALSQSPQILLEEALTFAIMAQNINVLYSLGGHHEIKNLQVALLNIHAMHIATSYLNGGRECCNILAWIVTRMPSSREPVANDHGHTVLDNIMLTILKNHSSTPFGHVDRSLKHRAEYRGIEVDICGRWDADSGSFRSLLAAGKTSIPMHWKHKFCNTSVQAICHCIRFVTGSDPFCFDHPSGLFTRLCAGCGARLCLTPLHTLILTGFELANYARAGEDLFGIIACLLCMLYCGSDPRKTANVSISSLLSSGTATSVCDHQEMAFDELAQRLADSPPAYSWSRELKIGWRLLLQICKRARLSRVEWSQRLYNKIKDYEDRMEAYDTASTDLKDDIEAPEPPLIALMAETDTMFAEAGFCKCPSFEREAQEELSPRFGIDIALPHLWASIQAEFLNYRRLAKQDPWLSSDFDMHAILVNLEAGLSPNTGYMVKELLKPHCPCGRFDLGIEDEDEVIYLRAQVSKTYFSNMDCWARTSLIERPAPKYD